MHLPGTIELAAVMLICWGTSGARTETFATPCNSTISTECACTMPALERHLGTEAAQFLAEIWEHSYSPELNKSSEFFKQNAGKILSVSIQYGEIKYKIAVSCGALPFKDDPE